MSQRLLVRTLVIVAALIVILAASDSGVAQYAPGDAVVGVADTTHHLLVVRPNGTWSTLVTLPFGPMWDLIPSPDNQSVWLAAFGASNGVFNITSAGVVTTVIGLTGRESPATLILDGNGDLFVSGTSTSVFKFSQSKLTTFMTGIHGALFGSAIDLNNGDLLLTVGNGVVRVPTYKNSGWSWARKDASGSMAPQGACFDPANNWLIETKTTQILRFDVTTSKLVTPTPTLPITTTGCGHIARDPNTGLFLIAGHHRGTGSILFRYDSTANVITTMSVMTHSTAASFGGSVAIAGSRHLASLNPAGPGHVIQLRVSSLNEAGRAYATAFSFGWRPGIKVGGRTIHLNPDALFFTSLQGGIFKNFTGVLDRNGEAYPTVQVPKIAALSGLRIYAAAITLAQSAINVISHPIVITIQ